MFTKTLLFALIAACGAPSRIPTEEPPKSVEPVPDVQEAQVFCCNSVDSTTQSGEGCHAISSELINSCLKVLSCGDVWTKDGGDVKCG